jgi:SAM-dependent methyltransferase
MTNHKKRIDFLTAEYAKVSATQFVKAVNDSYYRRSAGNYDATPDIAYDAAHAWQRIIDFLTVTLPDIANYSIVDIGSGTGFVAERVNASLLPIVQYVGYEPSYDMRQIAQMKHNDPRISFFPLNVELKVSETISGIAGPKIVTINSVLHHIVWWEDFLVEVVDSLNPGDLFVICHEPNSRFWENYRLVKAFDAIVAEKRTRTRSLAIYLNPLNYLRRIKRILGLSSKRQTLIDLINWELKEKGILQKDMLSDMIGAIIDYSVPLCWRNITCDKEFDEGFFSIERLKNEYFQNCEILFSFTYQHLAFSPTIVSDTWKQFDKDMSVEFPDDGAQFCLIVRKKG